MLKKDYGLLDRFVDKCPFAVLTQFAMRGLLWDLLEQVFEENRSRQYTRELGFADLALAVADVTLGMAGNFNQAYRDHEQRLHVARTSFYDKINATERPVSEALVRECADRAAEMQEALGYVAWDVLPGYRVYAIDGNHLPESEKRLGVLRDETDAPLPGITVARFDLERQLFDRAYLLEDAHAQESSTQQRIVADLEPRDLLIADRHHCVLSFLAGIARKEAAFLIRQHGRFQGVLVGRRRKIGKSDRGRVYEQEIRTSDKPDAQVMRRITIELTTPTEKGETEVHLLTNLPPEQDGITLSNLYLRRWEAETGFYYLTTTLVCELKSVGHPRAALFLFCMAMVAFNIRQVLFAALYAEHAEESVNALSHYHISVEVSRYTDGMLAAIDESVWRDLVPSDPVLLSQELRRQSSSIKLSHYRKSARGPKKKKPKLKRDRPKTHMSTAKALKNNH